MQLKRRADLRLVPQENPPGSAFLHDPLTGQTLHLGTVETYLWQLLDGRSSVSEILLNCQRMFAPRPVSAENLTRFLAQLLQLGLLRDPQQSLSALPGLQRTGTVSRLNPLAITWRGCNPDSLIRWLTPFIGWIFHPVWAFTLLLLWLITLGSLAHQSVRLVSDLRLLPVRGPLMWGWLALTIVVIKICHEFGHAIAARRVGVPCRELGVMLLFGFPLMYCNVSEATLLPRRRDRLTISAAGIYVELWLALLAAWIWLATAPGILQTLGLQVMLICSVNTLLLNGNPLLRYDGYYVFSDLLGVHNLRPRALAAWRRILWRIMTGIETPPPQPHTATEMWGLLGYGFAATLYSWGLFFSIWLVAVHWLEPVGLSWLAQLAGGAILLSWLGQAVQRGLVGIVTAPVAGTIPHPPSRPGWWRTGIGLILILLGLVGCAWLPVQPAITAALEIVPTASVPVLIDSSGTLNSPAEVPDGSWSLTVQQGETLLQLENLQLQRRYQEQLGESQRLAARIQSCRTRLGQEPQLAAPLAAIEQAFAAQQRQLELTNQLLQRCSITAPATGLLIWRVPASSGEPVTVDSQPLTPGMLAGRTFPVGTQLGEIITSVREGRLLLLQSELQDLRPGQAVRMVVPEAPGTCWTGVIASIGTEPLAELPPQFSLDQRMALRREAGQRSGQGEEPVYLARVTWDNSTRALTPGQLGTARIALAPIPLWKAVWRFLTRTFPLLGHSSHTAMISTG